MLMKDQTKRISLNKVMEMKYYQMDEDAVEILMEESKVMHEERL